MKSVETEKEEYYILETGKRRIGPFNIKQLENLKLEPTTPLQKKGQNNWQYAANIKQLNKKPISLTLERIALFLFTSIVALLILIFTLFH